MGRINKYSTESSSNNPSSSYGGGAGDYNSRKFGEKKGTTTTASNWDTKTQQQNNYLPQHIRQQKGPVKPSKHPNINDSNRNKKFTGGPPNLHNERWSLRLIVLNFNWLLFVGSLNDTPYLEALIIRYN